MKFYNREQELKTLAQLDQQADQNGIMTVFVGRRRVGKTILGLQHVQGKRALYLFVGRKEEHLLCQEFLEEIKQSFPLPIIGEIRSFRDIFALLLELAKKEKFTIIFDEFQEFFQINPTIYSDMQKLWDLNKHSVKLHVIFIGSVYSLMHKIFEDEKQPLFGRADRILNIKAFSLKTMACILKDHQLLNENHLFNFYILTGGMPKYLDIFLNQKIKSWDDMLDVILQKDALLLQEGKNVLIEEFGRDYLTYFTILELISQGKTARGEIEALLEKNVGGYLQRLEQDYAVITRHRPIHAKPNTKIQKYKIADNFLNFWFRFIYRHRTAIEIENFTYIREIIKRDYATYSGPLLERFFQQRLAETSRFNEIGAYWEKGNQNEIDVVAINELEKIIVIAETKRNKSKVRLSNLVATAQPLLKHYEGYQAKFLALSIDDALTFETLLD